jgi:hypothetical protein
MLVLERLVKEYEAKLCTWMVLSLRGCLSLLASAPAFKESSLKLMLVQIQVQNWERKSQNTRII